MSPGLAIGAALFFLLTLLSGSWLSHLGRPLNLALSTLHKLLGLGAGLYLLVSVIRLARDAPLGAGAIVAAVAAGLGMAGGAATGAFLSAKQPALRLTRLHEAAALVSLAGAAVLVGLIL